MPDRDGNFRGISVSRVWPGHRDYDPEKDLKREEAEWCDFLQEIDGDRTYVPKRKSRPPRTGV